MPRLRLLYLASTIELTSFGIAAPQARIPDALQQEAMTCVGEAAQICPEVWTAPDHGLTCMMGKRAAFSPRCRGIYDKVTRTLRIR